MEKRCISARFGAAAAGMRVSTLTDMQPRPHPPAPIFIAAALAAAGLAALFADPVPYLLRLEAIERDLSAEGEAAVGVITLRLRCEFNVKPASPETIL